MLPISATWIACICCVLSLLWSYICAQLAEFPLEQLLPEILTLPPPRIYFDPQSSEPLHFSCSVWPQPPFGKISYYTADKVSAHSTVSAPLHELPSDLLDSNGSAIVLSSLDSARRLSPYDLHCLASTQFGSVFSAPFTVVITDPQPKVLQVLVQNITHKTLAVVRCSIPDVDDNIRVQFLLNDQVLPSLPDKYLTTVSSTQRDHLLLIRLFESTDEGIYHCIARDSASGRILLSDSRKHRLQLRAEPALDFAFVGDFPEPVLNGSLVSLSVSEGANLSLVCSSSAPLPVRIERRSSNLSFAITLRFNALFGILSIDRVTSKDEGTYLCHIGNRTSAIQLHIKPRPWVTVTPMEVQQKRSTAVDLTCLGSEPSPLFWYHNGRAALSQRSSGASSILHIPKLDDSSTGVYQCVQRDSDGVWTTAVSHVSTEGRIVLRKSDYSILETERWHPLHLPSTTVSATIGEEISLHCLPVRQMDSAIIWAPASPLVHLPGSGNLTTRLSLAHRLHYVHPQWTKDDLPLQLQTASPSQWDAPLQFTMRITRPRDFGLYVCAVYTTNSQLLFSHSVHVKSSSYSPAVSSRTIDYPVDFLDKSAAHSLMNDSATDRNKRNAGIPNRVGAPPGSWLSGGDLSGSYESQRAWFNPPMPPQTLTTRPPLASGISDIRLSRPVATAIGDNLAANITWSAVQAIYYLIQFRHKLPLDPRWSKPLTADGAISECCSQTPSCCFQLRHFYFTSHQPDGLEPGRRYQFRVQAFSSDSTLVDKSPWSPVVSFEHISKIAPVFTETERLLDGSTVARWTLATTAVGFPIDHFLLLYRMEEREVNGKVTYSPFQHMFVPGSNTREVKLTNLEPGKGYQLVVYGVHTPPGLDPLKLLFQGGYAGRKITQFSHEIFVKPQLSSGDSSKQSGLNTPLDSVAISRKTHRETSIIFNSAESNHLMFLILGALAGLLLVIILCLIVLCICRQVRRQNHHKSRSLNWLPGSTSVSKDPANITKSHRQSSTFMLENLQKVIAPTNAIPNGISSVDAHQRFGNLSSVHPPPLNPPPPPPRWVYSELGVNMPERGALLHHPPYFGYNPAIPLAPGYPYWAMATASTANAMVGSQYSAQLDVPNFDGMGHAVLPMGAVPPCGMKREPPSGGSVHEATDTEADVQDQTTLLACPSSRTDTNTNYPINSTDIIGRHPNYAANQLPSVALGTSAVVHPNPLGLRDSRQPFSNYFINPLHSWQGSYNPGLSTPSPSDRESQGATYFPAQQQHAYYTPHHPSHPHENDHLHALHQQRHHRRRSHQTAGRFIKNQGDFGLSASIEAVQPLMASSPVTCNSPQKLLQNNPSVTFETPDRSRITYESAANSHQREGQMQYPPLPLVTGRQWTAAMEYLPCEDSIKFAADHVMSHPVGPLLYGNHNPGAAATISRRDSTHSMLVGSPPRVRDYSEYGILSMAVGTGRPNQKDLTGHLEQTYVPPSSEACSVWGTFSPAAQPAV